MKISIITAVYNRVDYISDAIKSINMQIFSALEHVIIDGASDDGTSEIVENMRNASMIVVREPDSGIYDALNKGIGTATGDIIGLLHSDDMFGDAATVSRVAAMFQSSDVDGVYGDLEYVAKDDPSRVIRYWQAGEYTPELLRCGWMPPHPTLFLRREVFERYGVYDTSFRIAADYDAMLRWLTRGNLKLAYLPRVLVKMRVGGESNRSIGRILRKTSEDYRALRNNGVGGLSVLAAKNLSKIPQFLKRAEN